MKDQKFSQVTIAMPKHLHEDLRRRAKASGTTVTALMRRAVDLDAMVYDPEHPTRELIIRDGNQSRTITPI